MSDVDQLPVAEIGPGPLVRAHRYDDDQIAVFRRKLSDLPPIDVRRHDDGSLSVLDGVHRLSAFEEEGKKKIPGRVHEGMTDVDAFAFAARANTGHGKPLTLAERKTNAEWFIANSKKSNRFIAETCGLDPKTVSALRPAGEENGAPEAREGKDGKFYSVSNKQAADELKAAIRSLMDDGLTDADIQAHLRCSVAPVTGERKRWLADKQAEQHSSSDGTPSASDDDRSGEDTSPDLPAATSSSDEPRHHAVMGSEVSATEQDQDAAAPASNLAVGAAPDATGAASGENDDDAGERPADGTSDRQQEGHGCPGNGKGAPSAGGGVTPAADLSPASSGAGPDATPEPVASGPTKAAVSRLWASAMELAALTPETVAALYVGEEREHLFADAMRLAEWSADLADLLENPTLRSVG